MNKTTLAVALLFAASAASAKIPLRQKRIERQSMKSVRIPMPKIAHPKTGAISKAGIPLTQRNAGWGLDGSWYNENFNGQGWFVQYLNKREEIWAAFFTYDDHGDKEWYVGQGPLEGDTATLTVYKPAGGKFMVPTIETPLYTTEEVGTAWITLDYCDQAYFEWDLSRDFTLSNPFDYLETIKLTDAREVNGEDLCESGIEDPLAAKRAK